MMIECRDDDFNEDDREDNILNDDEIDDEPSKTGYRFTK